MKPNQECILGGKKKGRIEVKRRGERGEEKLYLECEGNKRGKWEIKKRNKNTIKA